MAGKNQSIKIVAENRRARHEYHIHETFEAGIVLTGTEIKSLRGGRANLTDSYAKVENGELFLISAHISPYEQGNRFNHEPRRNRKLLMHKAEILRLLGKTREKGYTLEDLKNVAEGQKILYPSLNENTTCELVGGNRLHLDRKVGEQYETALILEQVDIL